MPSGPTIAAPFVLQRAAAATTTTIEKRYSEYLTCMPFAPTIAAPSLAGTGRVVFLSPCRGGTCLPPPPLRSPLLRLHSATAASIQS